MNELATSLEQAAEGRRSVRKTLRALTLEAIGPVVVLGGIVWAIAQPYRVAFFYPEGKGVSDWLVQPPVLVVLVGLLFALLVAPGLVEDLDAAELERDATR